MKGGQTVYLCFSTDFLLEDADPWREECRNMIGRVGCTVEDQKCADERLPLFARLPIKHKESTLNFASEFIKDGITYTLPVRELCRQARKASINC